MTAANFLSSSYRYFQRLGVSDVQTIIDDFDHETVTHGNWTEPSAELYVSPPDAVGRFFDVLLTRIDAQKLEWRVRDGAGVTICTRRINMPSTNTWNVRIYTGQFHAIIDVDPVSVMAETLQAGILDLSPLAQDAHTHWTYGHGNRTAANSYNSGDAASMWMVDNATAILSTRVSAWRTANPNYSPFGARTLNGSKVFRPRELWAIPTGASTYRKFAGRCYQQICLDGFVQPQAEFLVPIDTGLSARFKVLGLSGNASGASPDWRVAVRIS